MPLYNCQHISSYSSMWRCRVLLKRWRRQVSSSMTPNHGSCSLKNHRICWLSSSTGTSSSSSGIRHEKDESTMKEPEVSFSKNHPRSLASTPPTTASETENAPRPRRKRHRFDGMNEIPSFQQFQQKQQVRALYRKFLRLIYSIDESDNDGTSTRRELLNQLQRQFRQNYNSDGSSPTQAGESGGSTTGDSVSGSSASMSMWDIKRALSEGSKRYKEVSAMLGNAVKSKKKARQQDKDQTSEASPSSPKPIATTAWPWQQQSEEEPNGIPKRPSPFPKKSGL